MIKLRMSQMLRLILVFGLLVCMGGLQADESKLKTIDLEKDWGIQPVFLRITGGGYMIEFRYKVVDTQKALVLSANKVFPSMLSMKSKAKLAVPYSSTVGYMKSNRKFLKLNRNYIVFFANENRHMLPGDQVKIQVGDEVTAPLTIDK
jgi:hypothetical protein